MDLSDAIVTDRYSAVSIDSLRISYCGANDRNVGVSGRKLCSIGKARIGRVPPVAAPFDLPPGSPTFRLFAAPDSIAKNMPYVQVLANDGNGPVAHS